MATEAEIIPEPISVLKAEEEIMKPSSDSKKSEGGLDMPVGTDECLDKANSVGLASNGVETLSAISDSKGESFSIPPEVSEKTLEDDEKMSKVEVIEDCDSSPEEKGGSIEDEMSRNATETNKQDGNLEHKEQDSITNLEPEIDSSNEANEIVTEATEATDPIETSISEKDQIISDSIENTLTSKATETSDNHETTKEISEVAEKELQNKNPQEEAACVHEPAAQKLEEVNKEPEPEQHPIADISNSSVSDETVKESTKEDESISLELTEKASSSVELEDSKKDIEEKTILDGSTDTADPESAPAADETEEKKQENDNGVPAEDNGLATTGSEGVRLDGADIYVEPAESSVSCKKDKEISKEEDGMQDKVPYEHSKSPVPQEIDETLTEKADNPTLDVPKIESDETGPERLTEETLQDEQPSDLGLEKEKIEDSKLSNKATDVERVIQEKEVKQETEVPEGAHDKNPEVMNMNDNEGQSKETILEPSKSQADETITDVQKEETEKKINEEPEDKPEDEQNTNEVTKVKNKSSVSNECLKEGDSKEQVEAKNEAGEYSTEEREASLVVESEKLAPEPEVNEVEVTEVMPTELASEPEVNEVKVTKAVPTELASKLEVNEVEQTKAVATELASEPEVKEAEETKAVVTELASEPEVNEVGETKAMPTELALEPEVKDVEETKAVPTEIVSEPELKEVEETKVVATELASEPEVKEVEEIKVVATKLASEPEVKEVEETKVVARELASEPEVNEVEETKAVPTELASEPEVNEVEQTKAVPTELAPEPEVIEVEQTKPVVKHESLIEEECLQKEEESEPKAVSVEETIVDEGLQNEEPEAKQTAEICLEKEESNEVEDGKKDETDAAARDIEVEESKDQSLASALPGAVVDHETTVSYETVETELQKDESPEKIEKQTTEVEGALTEDKAVENEIIEKQIVCEDKPVENPSQASSIMPIEEESSLESSQADPEGTKATDNQIFRELEKVAESSQKTEVEDVKEVYPKEAGVGEKITDKSGEDITVSTPVEDSTKLAVETLKDDANNNVEKEIVAEDQTVKEQEQPQDDIKEATIVPGEKAKVIDNGEEKTDNSGVETNPEPAPATSTNISLSDLLQSSEEEKTEVAERVIEERELTVSKEAAPPVEDAENIQAKEAKTDEVPEGDEHNKTDSGSDAPVMVEAPRDTETKPHKKSQNIVSKAISKVRKVITGKSTSNSKEPKATSPKGGEK